MRISRSDVRWTRLAAAMAVVLTTATAGIWAATKGPDAGNYSATDATTYSFVDISGGGGGTSVLTDTDDGTATLTLPFPFTFYLQTYSLVCASTNGAVYFVTTPAACSGFNDFANTDLTSTPTVNDLPAVLPFWSDLSFDAPGAGAVIYQTLGASPSRRFVVQWQNVYPQGSPNPVTFQIVLSETTNRILFQYKSVGLGPGNPASNGALATVGVRAPGAPSNEQQIAWSFGAPVLTDSSAILFAGATTCASTVTSSVSVSHGQYDYNPTTQRFTQTVSVRNRSGATIPGPISLAFDGRSGAVSVYQPAGTTSCALPAGVPYVTVSEGALAPGATVTTTVQFVDPSRGGIAYEPRVLSGSRR